MTSLRLLTGMHRIALTCCIVACSAAGACATRSATRPTPAEPENAAIDGAAAATSGGEDRTAGAETLPMPARQAGDGWQVEYQRLSADVASEKLRLGTREAGERPNTILVTAPPGTEVHVSVPDVPPETASGQTSPSYCESRITSRAGSTSRVQFDLEPSEHGYFVTLIDGGGAFGLDIAPMPASAVASVEVKAAALSATPNLSGPLVEACRVRILELARFEKEWDAQRSAAPAPEESLNGRRSATCPSGWTRLTRGICYDVGRIVVEGVTPLVTLRIWSPTAFSMVPARLVLIEDGTEKCSDEFVVRDLRKNTITEVRYPCPPTELVEDLGRVEAVFTVDSAM